MWQSLYFYSGRPIDITSIEHSLVTTLHDAGYTRYNPFEIFPGKAYTEQVRLFIAPQTAGWIRVLGDVDEQLAAVLSQHGFALLCILDETGLDISAWQDGEKHNLDSALRPFRDDRCTEGDLRRAIARLREPFKVAKHKDDVLPLDALSDEMKQQAQGLGKWPKKLIFNQLLSQINRQFSGDERAARDLLKSREPDWNGELAARLTTLMDCLTVPDGWRTPDLGTVRDAYQLFVHSERFPNAVALPGDEETMNAVPNALDYVPVYAGRN